MNKTTKKPKVVSGELTNVLGDRGEAMAYLALTDYAGGNKPLIRPAFLGQKWPTIDYYAELEGDNKQTPVALFQVKTTGKGVDKATKSLPIQLKKEDAKRLARLPLPAFLGNERKRAIIRSMFSRTTQARHEKLALFLSQLGITECVVGGNRTPISPEKLNEIIQARNNLFHAGSHFDEKILWQHLFPLVTGIANAAHMEPLVL